MISYIPSPKSEKEVFSISIESQQFSIEYSYNNRSDSWFFSLIKNDVFIINNLKIVQGFNYGFNYIDFPLINGSLYLYSPTNLIDDANFKNFGKEVFLVYES